MHKLCSRGLRLASLMAIALMAAHCGDSSVRVVGGGGVDPTSGTFRGTTGNGGIVTLQIGSIEAAVLECQGQAFGGTCDPVLPVENGNASGTCSGVFDVSACASSPEYWAPIVKTKLAPKACADRTRLPTLSCLEMRSAPIAK